MILEAFTGTFLGYTIASMVPDFEIGQAMAPPIVVIFVLFAGVFLNPDSMPPGSEWI